MNPPVKVDLAELNLAELTEAVVTNGGQPFNARQVAHWIYRQGVTNFAQMTNLSVTLRQVFAETFTVSTPNIERSERSSDGTVKLLLGLTDGRQIEAVFIPDTPGKTFCISTQVGCAMQCGFCLTGKMGFTRNLSTGEIVGQIRVLIQKFDLIDSTFNVVLMGMGEPLHNYDAVMKALDILTDLNGIAMPSRRITLSTIGLIPALKKLATAPVMPNLAVSLHATTEELRSQLVPMNKKYSLKDLMEVCRRFPVRRREQITFEYVLIAGINDSMADVARLAALLSGMPAKVNVIPLNEAPGVSFRRPPDQQINRFCRSLADRGVTVMVRKSRGRDIRAACGQLIVDGPRPSTAQQVTTQLGLHQHTGD
jgi:23S rRNA (adenine2503-C2)-methyltransferase